MKTSLLTLTLWLSVSVVWAAFPDAHGSYPFGVLNQRTLTVEYRNPILRYVPAKSGVDEKSSYRTPEDPATLPVALANPCGMTGYFAPMDQRLKSGISVMPVCIGNQEAAMAQIKVGKVHAFVVAKNNDTDNCRRFFRNTQVPLDDQ